jgi:hypothetical protein
MTDIVNPPPPPTNPTEEVQTDNRETPEDVDQLNNIFFFGCWNNKGKTNKCMQTVIEDINSKQHKNPYDRGIILGDNIYPEKPKNVKIFMSEDMKYGMDALEKIGVPLDIVLGNHDVEDCSMLLTQINKEKYNRWKFDSNLSECKYRTRGKDGKDYNVRVVLIDTNVISDYIPGLETETKTEEKNAKAYTKLSMSDEKCSNILKHDNIITNPKLYYEKLSEILLPEKNKGFDLIILAGHDPLHIMKYKAGTPSKAPTMFIIGDLMNKVRNLKTTNNTDVIYICADTHAYVDSTITRDGTSLRQIIAGTGGASPDIYSDDDIKILKALKFENPENPYRTKVVEDMGKSGCHLNVFEGISIKYNEIKNSYGFCSFDVAQYIDTKGANGIVYHTKDDNKSDRNCFDKSPEKVKSPEKIKSPGSDTQTGGLYLKRNTKINYVFNRHMYSKLRENYTKTYR